MIDYNCKFLTYNIILCFKFYLKYLKKFKNLFFLKFGKIKNLYTKRIKINPVRIEVENTDILTPFYKR